MCGIILLEKINIPDTMKTQTTPCLQICKTSKLVFMALKNEEVLSEENIHHLLADVIKDGYDTAICKQVTADELEVMNVNIGDKIILYDKKNTQKGCVGVSKKKYSISWIGLMDQQKNNIFEKGKVTYFVFKIKKK